MPTEAIEAAGYRTIADVRCAGMLGIKSGAQPLDAARWKDAAAERMDKARETGAGGIDAMKNFGSGTRNQAKSVKNKLTGKLSERKLRRGGTDEDSGDEDG